MTDITGATVAAQSYEAWGSRDQMAQGGPNWPTDMQFGGGWGYQNEYSNLPNEPGLGLDYLQQRYYDPVVGRFMEPDPLGLAAGTNLFEYAGDDPVSGVDPSGLFPDRWTSIGTAASAYIVAGKWDELADLFSEYFPQNEQLDIQDRLLQPLFQGLQRSFQFLNGIRPSAFECPDTSNRLREALFRRFPDLIGSEFVDDWVQTVRVQAAGRLFAQRGWFEGLRFWPGAGEIISENGYHEALRIGPRVFDAVTGPNGLLYTDWLKRIGITAAQVLPQVRGQ